MPAAVPAREFRLMRSFALTGALAIGGFGVAMALLLDAFLETRMLERDAALSRDFVQGIANTQQVAPVFRSAGPVEPGSEVAEFFDRLAAMPDVLRFNVYSPDRRVLWSSRPEITGRTFAANDELDAALAGRVVTHIDDAPSKDEHVLLSGRSRDFVEDYLPIYDERGRELIGVVELYRQPAALFEAIRSGRTLVWSGAALGALALYLSLIGLVRRAERMLREQRSQLVEAQALALVGELSASVAHSIRNPLGSIRSTAELQQALGADGAAMDDIMRHVDRIDRLLRELLSGGGDERHAAADLAAVLDQTQARYAPILQAARKELRVELARPLGEVAADPLLMAQVFDSLLANADEATAAGDRIELSARRAGDEVEIVLRDSGRGLGALRDEQLFEPLFTTKPHGLGMGLVLVRRVIDRLGGRIALRNGERGGAVVTLNLPVR